jgi:hypothetical protein
MKGHRTGVMKGKEGHELYNLVPGNELLGV